LELRELEGEMSSLSERPTRAKAMRILSVLLRLDLRCLRS
jgi:hypothetical protein